MSTTRNAIMHNLNKYLCDGPCITIRTDPQGNKKKLNRGSAVPVIKFDVSINLWFYNIINDEQYVYYNYGATLYFNKKSEYIGFNFDYRVDYRVKHGNFVISTAQKNKSMQRSKHSIIRKK